MRLLSHEQNSEQKVYILSQISHYSQLNCFVGFFYDKRKFLYFIYFIIMFLLHFISHPSFHFFFRFYVLASLPKAIALLSVCGSVWWKSLCVLVRVGGYGGAGNIRLKVELINQNGEEKEKEIILLCVLWEKWNWKCLYLDAFEMIIFVLYFLSQKCVI
jgi:hypothetical protein